MGIPFNIDNVVYFLGAGFSRPLGLPLMSDFLSKAKDIYSFLGNKERHKFFKKVFTLIGELSKIKNYVFSDLENIEEILSILEIENQINNNDLREAYIEFITEVINIYTPPFMTEKKIYKKFSAPPTEFIEDVWENYFYFVLNLFNVCIDYKIENDTATAFCVTNPRARYSVISLNYDLVLERSLELVKQKIVGLNGLSFSLVNNFFTGSNQFDCADNKKRSIGLAKLHGSIDKKNIIAPTWNKNLNDNIRHEWDCAYSLLSHANHIRFIGYSLPDTDVNIRYFIKSALSKSFNLKTVDVICLDPTGDVRVRYDKFITKSNLRFANVDVYDYLSIRDQMWHSIFERDGPKQSAFFEAYHSAYFNNLN